MSRVVEVTGWMVPIGVGRPGSVTSAASDAPSARPRRAARLSAYASSMAAAAALAARPYSGRSSGATRDMPRLRRVTSPFLPRYSTRQRSRPSSSEAADSAARALAVSSAACGANSCVMIGSGSGGWDAQL